MKNLTNDWIKSMKKINASIIFLLLIIGSNYSIKASDDKNSQYAQIIAEKQAEQKLQKEQRQANQREENRKKDAIDSYAVLIRTYLKIDLDVKEYNEYRWHSNHPIVKTTYLIDGSYFQTQFDPVTMRPLETRLYQPTDDNYYINTKLTIHHENNIADVHSLDCDSYQINSQRFVQLGYAPATYKEPARQEYRLSKSTGEIKLKKSSRSYLDMQTIIENIAAAQESGNIIEIVEKDDI